jgi:protein dithiol oxidoreductase (disulfide-forming)
MRISLRASFGLLLSLLLLPMGAQAQLRWQEGQHYKTLPVAVPPSVPAGKIEVTEVFSYGCIYCFRAKDPMRELGAGLPADAVLTFVHASFNPAEAWPMFQRAFYTAQSLGVAAAAHDQLFTAIWETGEFPLRDPKTGGIRKPLPTLDDAAAFYQKYAGVNSASFLEQSKSKQVDDAVKRAEMLVGAYRVSGTPTLVVNGRYLVMNENLGNWGEMRQLVNFLVAQERRRLGLPTPAPTAPPAPAPAAK